MVQDLNRPPSEGFLALFQPFVTVAEVQKIEGGITAGVWCYQPPLQPHYCRPTSGPGQSTMRVWSGHVGCTDRAVQYCTCRTVLSVGCGGSARGARGRAEREAAGVLQGKVRAVLWWGEAAVRWDARERERGVDAVMAHVVWHAVRGFEAALGQTGAEEEEEGDAANQRK
eukprot:2390797-Rhodomonas_salina.2